MTSRVRWLGAAPWVLILATAVLAALAMASNRDEAKRHWGDGAGGGPGFVTLVDRTGAQWPVFAAAIEWDNAGRLNIIYVSSNCGNHSHCVGVEAPNFGTSCNNLAGFVYEGDYNPVTNHYGDGTYIRLNSACNYHTTREQRVITCHEEGNAVGLHDEPSSLRQETCMGARANLLGSSEETPRHHDFVMLDDVIYDHID